ncbi:hypothetical protein J1614_010854 [Plenodomus biglobosus]|nr:hypothetical protein J1614_010854 [Plenodomus biglobosus]
MRKAGDHLKILYSSPAHVEIPVTGLVTVETKLIAKEQAQCRWLSVVATTQVRLAVPAEYSLADRTVGETHILCLRVEVGSPGGMHLQRLVGEAEGVRKQVQNRLNVFIGYLLEEGV